MQPDLFKYAEYQHRERCQRDLYDNRDGSTCERFWSALDDVLAQDQLTSDMRKKTHRQSGFTLIETIIYIALLGLIMTGALLSAYNLIVSTQSGTAKTVVEEEGSFVERKIDWALAGAASVTAPHTYELAITKYDGTTVDIKLASTTIMMQENAGAFAPITTSNVKVTNLQFQIVGSNPAGVMATTTMNGLSFVSTRYIRK